MKSIKDNLLNYLKYCTDNLMLSGSSYHYVLGMCKAISKAIDEGGNPTTTPVDSSNYVFPGDPTTLTVDSTVAEIESIMGNYSDLIGAIEKGKVLVSKAIILNSSATTMSGSLSYNVVKLTDDSLPNGFGLNFCCFMGGLVINLVVLCENNSYKNVGGMQRGTVQITNE